MEKVDLNKINKQVESQILIINEGIKWVDQYLLGDRQRTSHDNLVNLRRKLKKIKFAFNQNPSAAVYGESQVGKSYLVKNLLASSDREKKKEVFRIFNPSEQKYYDFLEEINPEGKGAESTSVPSRFSSGIEYFDENYPIKIRMLTPKDLALLLVDSYLLDVTNHKSTTVEEINNWLDNFESLIDKSYHQEFIHEDDIYAMKEYFEEHFSTSIIYNNLKDTSFWTEVSKNLQHIKPEDWKHIFKVFWAEVGEAEGGPVTEIFETLIQELSKYGYSTEAYMEFDGVLRKYGTILDVTRLREIASQNFGSDYKKEVAVKLPNGDELKVSKNLLCVLAAELTFKVDRELNESKRFLKNLDLLDFPGARSRLKLNREKVGPAISEMILRGKVSYIFNKFSSDYLISNLLYCNNSMQPDVTYIPRLLNTWISNFIGRDMKEREAFLSNTQIPPLFVIYTWYNTDLAFDSTNYKSYADLAKIWEKRFIKFFKNEIVTKNYKWDVEWRETQKNFSNNYLLRDFLKSEEFSNIFKGYMESGSETSRVEFPAYPNYWEDLKNSFLEYDFVKRHFNDPAQTWEETSTLNNDGSIPILRNLTIASEASGRDSKFIREIRECLGDLILELKKHFHDDKADDKIRKALQKAGRIQLDLDTTFGKNPYFFGNLIKKLMLKEGEVYNFFLEKINEIELIEETNLSEYAAIRFNNPDLKINAPFEDNLAVLKRTYGDMPDEELIEYFESRGIDLDKLFNGQADNLKSNSTILASDLIEKWYNENLTIENFKNFAGSNFSEDSVQDLLDNIKNLSENIVDLKEVIAKGIRIYVDSYDKIDKVFEMIADISTAAINKFISTMGYDFYSEDKIDELKKVNEENKLNLSFDHQYLDFEPMDQEAVKNLFETLDNLDKILNQTPINYNELKNVPQFSNFKKWSDLMKISFASTCDVPTYDIHANNKLGEIIEKTETVPSL